MPLFAASDAFQNTKFLQPGKIILYTVFCDLGDRITYFFSCYRWILFDIR